MVSNPLGTERGWWVRAFSSLLANEEPDVVNTEGERVEVFRSERRYQVPYPLQAINDVSLTSYELIGKLRRENLLSYLIEEGREAEFCKLWDAYRSLSNSGHELKACILIIKHWLGECWSHHQICNSEPEGWIPELPHRLVYLGELLTTNITKIKIIDTTNQTNIQYIAVSYRWPATTCRDQKLNKNTRDEFYRGYPVSRLLTWYADTFKVAAMLGIKYVWIDALCIMQDVEKEWHTEASKLASVYGNSVLTIAYGDGFSRPIQEADGRPYIPENCRLEVAVKAASRPFLKGIMTEYDGRSPESVYSWLETSGNFPRRPEGDIDRRGWAFQERLLSKRILSITKDGFFWDCCCLNATDSRPLGLRGDFSPNFRDLEERKAKTLLLTKHPDQDTPIQSDIYLLWRRILQQYTRRSFTYDRDRLVALEGVVKRFKAVMKEECFLGIWKGDALRSLVWFSVTPSEYPYSWVRKDGPPELQVPSWSWASVYPPIGYRLWHPYQRYTEHNIEIVSPCAYLIKMNAGPMDDTFSSYSGMVSIKGSLSKHSSNVLASPGCKMILDSRPWEYQQGQRDNQTLRPFFEEGVIIGDWSLFKEEHVYILPILKGGYSTNLQAYYCLVLRDVSPVLLTRFAGRQPDGPIPTLQIQFQRIGLFVVDFATKHDFCLNTWTVCKDEKCKALRKRGTIRCSGTTSVVRIV